MSIIIINSSTIFNHPTNSLAAEDYIPTKERVKELLLASTHTADVTLQWLMENGLLTPALLEQYMDEYQIEWLAPVEDRIAKMRSTANRLVISSKEEEKQENFLMKL